MATTHQQPQAGGRHSPNSAPPDALAVAATLVALRLIASPETRMPLDVATIAGLLWPREEAATAIDRAVMHLLLLEEARQITTGIETDGQEWIHLDGSPFSPGVSESARASGRARASAGEQPRERPPRRPWFMDAPPIGCVDHPRGSRFPCGPCRTARLNHEMFMLQGRARAQLADWESVNGPVEDWEGDESGSTRGEVLFDEPF
ncbi:hypothetical protein [Microbacterium sp. PAMC21962]|uniref:hypothetical protein n=1 Tax=Microbacterium sp. PAMC21962 TaxID=2861280 RepID=UPI001C6397F0|nr:hypothetical protein [Microbacterium sp. PAMC21962]QYF98922.1 hypothetical protein KY498_06830 [Microbacterium sp. PAMC21962]